MSSIDVRKGPGLASRRALRIVLRGRVQGLGIRPAVARLAADWNVAGIVVNRREGVEIVVEGAVDAVAAFQRRLDQALPPQTVIEDRQDEAIGCTGQQKFVIVEEADDGPVRAEVPRDAAVCEACLRESAAGTDRRWRYPFTSCSECGPRFSIVTAMPFERRLTTMASFRLCPQCRVEYETSQDRRFHAQTIACPVCGPQVWCTDAAGQCLAVQDRAVATAVAALRRGEVLALRGIGGYQLLCDATNPAAVQRLRSRKCRPAKPLAVLVASIRMAERLAHVGTLEREELESPANPIVLVAARSEAVLAGIHPGLTDIGLMLPTTPLHWILASEVGRPLVATSGNHEGDPLVVGVSAAQSELAGIADLFLHHDRDIAHPVDDSVVRVIAGRAVTIRLGRGLAPLPLELSAKARVLAAGGQQKSAVAISNGSQAVLGPHVGDLDGLASRARFAAQVEKLLALYGTEPELVVHDLHPDYFTTRWALDRRLQTLAVQHHHAHIAAGMLEQHWLDREVLGVALDGTGYGPGGTIWGGEFLRCTLRGFQRVGRLRPFRLPGGEAAIREPWRTAVALVLQAAGPGAANQLAFDGVDRSQQAQVVRIAEHDRYAPVTTSAGRLFDAVAALVLPVSRVRYEGEAAMLLEAACDLTERGAYDLPIRAGELLELDWRPMLMQLLADRAAGIAPQVMATRFHRGLAMAIASFSRRFRTLPVVLSGGVFQNRVLVELIVEQWGDDLPALGLPGRIPPNDGGLAAGQLAIGMAASVGWTSSRSSSGQCDGPGGHPAAGDAECA